MIKSSKQIYREYRRSRKRVETPDLAEPTAAATDDELSPARRYWRDYLIWLRPHLWELVGVFVLAVIAVGMGLVVPYATKFVTDGILLNDAMPVRRKLVLLHTVGLGLLVLLLAQQGIQLLRSYRSTVLNAKIVVRLRQRLYDHALHLSLDKLGEMKTGGVISRLSGDVDLVTRLVETAILTPGIASIRVLMTLAILVAMNWKLAVVAGVFIPPIVLLNFAWVRRVKPIYRSIRQDRAAVEGRAVETFSGIRVVRAFQRQNKERREFAVGHHAIMRKGIFAQMLQLVIRSGWGLLIPLVSLMIIWFGGTLYLRGQCSIGQILAFQLYVLHLLQPVSQIVNSYGTTQRALAAMERTFDLLREPIDKPDPPHAVPAPARVEQFVFDGVWFAYRDGEPVLKGFCLTVPAGTTVALVGPSGAGKTTVTNLVARFYDPTAGAIRLNGIDLRDIQLRSYRRLLGMVQQDVFLFDGTIAENIAFGRRGATRREIIAASKRANAHAFITDLPDGYDTLIGERGMKLSGGQCQRISIARAILADPKILILDEATSNLDTESEQLIQASLADLFRGRTTFVIAHRLSTIMHADIIVVLDAGHIVELGDHRSLMAAHGMYYEMVCRQMRLQTEATRTTDWD